MRRRLTVRTLVATALLAAIVAGMFAETLSAVLSERSSASLARSANDRSAAALLVEKLMIDAETGLRGYEATGDRSFLAPYTSTRSALPSALASLERAAGASAAEQRAAASLEAAATAYLRDYAEPLVSSPLPRGRTAVARLTGLGKARMDALRARFDGYVRNELDRATAARAQASANTTFTVAVAIAGLVLSVLLVAAFALSQLRSVLAPVRRIAEAARAASEGDLSVRVPDSARDEVGDLGRAFNTMTASLEQSRFELENQNAELESQQLELELVVNQLADEKGAAERFNRYSALLAAESEVEGLARIALRELGDIAGATVGAVYFATDDAAETLSLVAAAGLAPSALARRIHAGEGLTGRAARERRTLATSHGESGLRLPGLGSDVEVRSELHVPLVHGAHTLGVITLGRTDGHDFAADTVRGLEALAERTAVNFARARSLRLARLQAAITTAVLDTTAEGFIAFEPDGRVREWNPRCEELFGFSAEQAIGRHISETIVPAADWQRYQEVLAAFVDGEGEWPAGLPQELRMRHADGHELAVEASVTPLRLDSGYVFNAFVRDITERKLSERYSVAHHEVTHALAQATTLEQARATTLAALAPALGFDYGAAWRVEPESGRIRSIGVWVSGELDAAALERETADAALAAGEGLPGSVLDSGRLEFRADGRRASDWTHRPLLAAAGLRGGLCFPIASGNDVLSVVELLSRDRQAPDAALGSMLGTLGQQIGQYVARKLAETEADRLKDEFFALVSHELRTPLTSIIGYLELVLEGEEVDPQSRHFLEVVDRNAHRLLRLVGDLLFVAQVEAGKLSLDPSPVDLAVLAAEAVEAAGPRAQERDVTLSLDVERLPMVSGDAGRIAQAIDNLVSNALKFTPEGGRVDVVLQRNGGDAVLEVRDTGMGIADGEQERLFERFFRSSTATEQAVPGVGLGLTIVKAIVEGHGGRIGVESREGIGTTFTIELPLADTAGLPAPPVQERVA